MQLEIKLIIDFGPDGPDRNDDRIIERNVQEALDRERMNGAFTTGTEAEIETVRVSMGWTSSGDDEE